VKPALYGDDDEAKRTVRRTLVTVLDQVLRLLHPLMPFLTEEIWQALPMQRPTASIMIAPYPRAADAWRDADAEAAIGQLIEAVTAIRNIRADLGIAPTTAVSVHVAVEGNGAQLQNLEGFMRTLARVERVEVLAPGVRPSGEPSSVVAGLGEVFVPLRGVVDAGAVRDRLQRDLAKVEKELQGVEGKLGKPSFVEKAPEDVVEKERQRASALRDRRAVLERHVETLAGT
jgi:valyl-tRNA synthetase